MINPYEDIITLNNQYVVHFKELTQSIQKVGGVDIQLDTRFNAQHHASERTTVLAAPDDDDIRVGDELIVQYLVVDKKNSLDRDANGYYQLCDRDQIFTVLRDNEIIMIDEFILVKPEETDDNQYEEVGGLLLPKAEKKGRETMALVTHIGNKVDNVEVGDRVKIHKSAQYPLTINGERYYRVRSNVGLVWRYKRNTE